MRLAPLLFLLVLVTTTRAAAQAPAAEVEAADAAASPEAVRLTREGLIQFDLGEYDRAIELFKRAYSHREVPGLLYNIAQAHRLKGDCARALPVYRKYARSAAPDELRARAEARAVEMERCVAEKQRASQDAAAANVRARQALVEPPAVTKPGPVRARWPAVSLIAISVPLAATGAVFSWQAHQAASHNREAIEAMRAWGAEERRNETWGRRADRIAVGLYGAAVVSATAGLYLLLR